MTKRTWLEIIVGLLLLFTIAWIGGPASPGYRGAQIRLRPQGRDNRISHQPPAARCLKPARSRMVGITGQS